MATQVVMPKLSPTMEEGQLTRWLKKEGEKVSVGEPLAEIDTDKATMEAQALATGVLRKIIAQAGDTVPLGAIIAIIGEPDEDISELLSQAQSPSATEERKQQIKESVKAGGDGAQAEIAGVVAQGERTQATIKGQPLTGDVSSPAATSEDQKQPSKTETKQQETSTETSTPPDGQRRVNGGRTLVSPIAARMAAEAGLNLQSLKGSGPGGRIIKRDIESALSEASQQQKPATTEQAEVQTPQSAQTRTQQPFTAPSVEGASPFRDEAISTIRATIARRLVSSLGPVPHFFLTTEIEMDKAADFRKQINELDPELKVSINDVVIKVAAAALVQHPSVNASFQEKSIRYYERADIGVAVAIDEGLITPVVRSADRKSIGQISREVRALAERARARKLTPEEYTGATFSVSNLGMFGIDEFTAVINPPEASIIAVGAMQAKPVVRDGALTIRQMMRVTMSCDHRVIDGATGAKFLQTFKKILENPLLLLA